MVLLVVFSFLNLVPSSGVLLQCETIRDQFTCSISFYLCPVAIHTCVKLDFACVYFCFWGLGICKHGDK